MPLSGIKSRYLWRKCYHLLKSHRSLIDSRVGERRIWERTNFLAKNIPIAQAKDFTFVLPEEFRENAVAALQQKVFDKTIGVTLSPSIMLADAGSNFSIVARYPGKWRRYAKSIGANINPFSVLFWSRDVVAAYRQGIARYKILLQQNLPDIPHGHYGVIDGLTINAFNGFADKNTHCETFLTWFQGRFGHPHNWVIPVFPYDDYQDERVTISNEIFGKYPDADTFREFKASARKAIILSVCMFLTGRWQTAYLLPDIIDFYYIRHFPKDRLADLYAFTNSRYIHRPLWTYAAEQEGCGVALIFYATNTFNYMFRDEEPLGIAQGYPTMTWPVIHTKSQEHAEYLKQYAGPCEAIHVEGAIPFEDSLDEIKITGKRKVVIFDVQPFRDAFMAGIGRPCHVYNPQVSIDTILPILRLGKDMGLDLYVKPKRDVGTRISKAYMSVLRKAEEQGILTVLDWSVSPEKLSAQADAVICQPFTSAALYAKKFGKPVVFFDEPGFFEEGQPACQEVDIIYSEQELRKWLEGIFYESKTAA